MNKLSEHIQNLAEFLEEKGYKNAFIIDGKKEGSLVDMLSAYVQNKEHGLDKNNFSCQAITTADFIHPDGDDVSCKFKLRYSEESGFLITQLKLARYTTENERVASMKLTIHDQAHLPTEKQVCAMMDKLSIKQQHDKKMKHRL